MSEFSELTVSELLERGAERLSGRFANHFLLEEFKTECDHDCIRIKYSFNLIPHPELSKGEKNEHGE